MNQTPNHPRCEDEEKLARLLDGELSAEASELIFHHLECCRSCAATFQHMKEEKLFALVELGAEGELEADFTSGSLSRVRERLEAELWAAPAPRRLTSLGILWRQFWPISAFWTRRLVIGAAIFLALAVFAIWLRWPGARDVSADEIITLSRLREKERLHEPGKVFHWVVEEDLVNHRRLPDGHYRSLHWQNNIAGETASIIRRYDDRDRLVWARWIKPDGTEVVFDGRAHDELRINPGQEEIMLYALRLPADLKSRVEERLKKSPLYTDPARRYQHQLDFINRALKDGVAQIVQAPEVGRTFRVHREFRDRTAQGIFIRGAIEEDYDAETLRRFHLKSTRYYPDGRDAIEIAHWSQLTETTSEDFAAHDLRDVIPLARHTVNVTPAEWVQMMLKREQLMSGLKP
jgi:hypothetical protein